MDGSRRTKPIDFLKNDIADILAEAAASSEPLYLTEGDQPRLVLLDASLFAQYEEQIALLKVLSLGQKEIAQGKFRDAEAVFAEFSRA
jgi:PHD/YefM family antitoxin component YafN of YafNO toxin-antitoxin module